MGYEVYWSPVRTAEILKILKKSVGISELLKAWIFILKNPGFFRCKFHVFYDKIYDKFFEVFNRKNLS